MAMKKSLLILAGGGGHTGYAKMLAEDIGGRASLFFMVPEDDELSRRLLSKFGDVDVLVKPRHPRTSNVSFIYRFIKSFFQSICKVKGRYDLVVSTGSNFCVPPAIFAWLKGIPVISIESSDQFDNPSKTVKFLESIALVTALQWEEQRNLVDGEVFGPFIPKRRRDPRDDGYILVAGGTYGYEELIELISESSLEDVVLQTGQISPDFYREKHANWEVFQTRGDFDELIANAHIVITPPGVTSLEAVAYGKPVIITRYPSWSHAGTLRDARMFAEKLNVPFISEFNQEELRKAIKEAEEWEQPDLERGSKKLAEYILNL